MVPTWTSLVLVVLLLVVLLLVVLVVLLPVVPASVVFVAVTIGALVPRVTPTELLQPTAEMANAQPVTSRERGDRRCMLAG